MEKKVKQNLLRKRGRPAGKNRVPLSQNERRARNAQYERERREEMSGALADLAAAVGVTGSISNAELLATVITELQRASQVKHSSDLDSLRRCNKNLMAQILTLEQRLTESDEIESSGHPTGELTDTPRPVKRKRDDCEAPVDVPVPKRSPRDYEPSLDYAVKQDHENEAPVPEYLSKQEFLPADSQSSLESSAFDHRERVANYSPFTRPHVPAPECKIETKTEVSEFNQPVQPYTEQVYYHHDSQQCRAGPFSSESSFKQDHTSFSEGTKHTLSNAFVPTDPWLPIAATSDQGFPASRESPVSGASEQQDCDVDYSNYHFAGPQVPTPEYQLDTTVVPSEYINPVRVQPYTEEAYCHPSPWMCSSGPSSPEEQFSPYQYLIPGTHHGFSSPQYHLSGPSMDQQQPIYEVPVQPNACVGQRGVHSDAYKYQSTECKWRGARSSPRRILSPENLIAMYFSPMDSTAI
ncbi:uncharacterized protein LOC134799217 isoform X2 [Cydia splendana]|uniref:uncharacterized protein LOC134799217 isoform X2 n=1 Tax=Cydia splendana TaxID=1100963 RepID=UPI00300C0537